MLTAYLDLCKQGILYINGPLEILVEYFSSRGCIVQHCWEKDFIKAVNKQSGSPWLPIVILLPLFRFVSLCICIGLQTCDDSRYLSTELKPRHEMDLQCHWGVPQGSHSQLIGPFPAPVAPLVHHSILHHQAPSAGGPAYDTLSLESSDSMETSISTGNNSTCSPERWETEGALQWFENIGLAQSIWAL